ncbi:MAG: hypothetical protein A3H93_06210 [Rhodocyclales bacterium RIFCSPLOWO2_02_FULL_63_24]|nr:MAG: hypothetical protein A2040_02440 [Rhodocyclales bacterium GWA2_65_19]OHC72418.1 MAG: hypothetical protein A3H93_06210 [Rhodocyclales bacterium RIFCSPLOWO2_02_FULL_63_24]
MSPGIDSDPTSNIKLLDRFYGTFVAVGVAFLLVGVPFVFYRKVASAAACVVLLGLVAVAWQISRAGRPQKSLKLFAGGLWLILVALTFAGLPPITAATMLAVAVMLAVVVSMKAGVLYCTTYMLAWLAYVVLGMLDAAPPPYFAAKPLALWFIGATAIWLVLLPFPTLIRNMQMALALQRSTLEAASDGILVIDNANRMLTSNHQFAGLWRIPADVLATNDGEKLIDFFASQVEDPGWFAETMKQLQARPEESSADTVPLKDGRVFECYSQPQCMAGKISGRVWSFRDITQRRTAERERYESEALKTSVLTHAPYAIIATDAQGVITVFNPRAEALLGYRSDELIGKQTPALFHDHDEIRRRADELSNELGEIVTPGVDVVVVKTRHTHMPDENEWTYVRRDGQRFPVLLSVTAIKDADGQISGYLGVATDITERKQAAQRLAESQQRMELALTGADLGLLDWDIPSGRFSQNARFLEMLGYARGEAHIDARSFAEMIHPSDRDHVRKAIVAHLKGDTPGYDVEHRTRHKSDRWVWILARGKVVERDDCGRASRMVGTVLDITERKHSEEALKARETRLANLIGSIQELVFVLDTEGRIIEYHLPPSFRFPVSAEAALGRYFPEILPEQLSSFVAEAMVGIFADAQVRTDEFALVVQDRECVFQVTMSQLSGSGKYASGFLTLVRDISERKHAEQEQRIAAIAFDAQEGIVITDAQSVILRVNKAFSEITGYSAGDVVGHKTKLLKSGRHDKDFYAMMWNSIQQTGTWQGEIWNRHKSGEIYPQWLTVTAVRADDGTVTHYVGTQIDITERKAAEAEIVRLAYQDPLTRLANRRLLLDRLQHAMAFSARSGREGALLILDLDEFKALNEAFGHAKGDLLLQQVAQRLIACVREADTVARLGGDEFVVMLEGLSDDRTIAVRQAEGVGRKILAALNQRYVLGGDECDNTPSIGGTLFFGHRNTVDELLQQADLAMYQAKAAGRNALRFFDSNVRKQ